ncbi:MAG TPA: hypothetical protein QF468_11655 [Nitrospinota bacterium]|nr:hypothetical protein [Nitrospinota bacterium]
MFKIVQRDCFNYFFYLHAKYDLYSKNTCGLDIHVSRNNDDPALFQSFGKNNTQKAVC